MPLKGRGSAAWYRREAPSGAEDESIAMTLRPRQVSGDTETGQPNRAARFPAATLGLLAILSPVGVVLAAPLLAAVYCYLVPAHSAATAIDRLGVTVELNFHYTLFDGGDGRSVTARTASERMTRSLCGYDWAHAARTSLYLTSDRRVAILGSEDGCEALITPSPLAATSAITTASETWTYLGAFDFTPRAYGRALRFFPAAEQAECVPWSGSAERPRTGRHREAAWGRCR